MFLNSSSKVVIKMDKADMTLYQWNTSSLHLLLVRKHFLNDLALQVMEFLKRDLFYGHFNNFCLTYIKPMYANKR